MSESARRILGDALELPYDDRATVTLALLRSLDGPDLHPTIDDEELLDELVLRADSTLADPGIPWVEVRDDLLRRHLAPG